MSTLIVFLVRIGIFAVLTFAFVVLYQHGPSGFVAGVPVEWDRMAKMSSSLTQQRSKMPPANPPGTTQPEPSPTN